MSLINSVFPFNDNLHDFVSSLSQRCLNAYIKMELPESNNNF